MGRVRSEAPGVSMSRSELGSEGRRLRVETSADWDAVAEATADFHDAVVREAALVGDEYLDADYMLRMTAEVGAVLRLLLHVQSRDVPAAALTFIGVRKFTYDPAEQVDPARCSAAEDGLLLFEVASATVKARSCEITLLGNSALGEQARLANVDQDVM